MLTAVAPPVRFTDTILLRNACLVSFDPPAVMHQDLMISNGLVTATGVDLKAPSSCDVFDASGMVLMPGFVDLRADLLSEPLPGFPELNAAARPCMGEEAVIWSGFTAGLRALRAGTTCVFAMQSAPGFALGALPRLREVLLTLGLRGVLAYKAETGREGAAAASRDAALYGGGEQLRMAVGCGDAATAGPLLKELGALSERCQVPFFGEAGVGGSGKEALAALQDSGLANARAILTVGGGLDAAQAAELLASGAALVHLPQEDLAAGRALGSVPLAGAGIGSGCGSADVLAAARLAVGLARGRGSALSGAEALAMIAVGHRVASKVFGLPFGSFEPGSVADFVLWRYTPSMPLTAETVAEHVLEGLRSAQIDCVIANGRFVIRQGKLQTLDENEILFAAQRGAIDLHQRLTGRDWPGLAALMAVPSHAAAIQHSDDDGTDLDAALENDDWNEDDSENGATENGDAAESTATAPAAPGAVSADLMEWPAEDDLDPAAKPRAAAATAAVSDAEDDDLADDDDDDDDEADDAHDDEEDGDDSDEAPSQEAENNADPFGFGVFS